MRGFVKLTTIDGAAEFVASDQIAAFVMRDRYRPNYQSIVTLKTGDRITVEESVETIVDRLVEASDS